MDKIFTPDVMNALISLVAMILVSLITIVSIKVKSLFGRYVEAIENEKFQKYLTNAYDHLGKVVEDAVLFTKQTMIDDLKREGKLTPEMMEKALQEAKGFVLKNTSEMILDALHCEYGDLDDLILALIESKLGKIKNEK